MINLKTILLTAALSASATTSHAATLTLNSSATASGGAGIANDIDFQTVSDLTATAVRHAASDASPSGGSAEASATASINARNGEMKFVLNGERSANECSGSSCDSSFYADALTRIVEDFTVSGTGTLTALMEVEANWRAPRYDFNAFVSMFGGPIPTGDLNLSFNSSNMPGSSVSRLLSASVDFSAANEQNIKITWGIQGLIASAGDNGAPDPNATGFMDAGNTATIFLIASDGLKFEAATDGFLSDPAFQTDIAAVPVPASLPMLFAGLIGLFAIKRRSKFAS